MASCFSRALKEDPLGMGPEDSMAGKNDLAEYETRQTGSSLKILV
jgi:hypothetical protein